MVIIMWNGKKKAVTFSYDDGVEQDRRLIALFNKYGMKSKHLTRIVESRQEPIHLLREISWSTG